MNNNQLSLSTRSLEELCDGIALLELMHQVSPEKFSVEHLVREERNKWPFKLSNISRLVKGLEALYTEDLNVADARVFSAVDCPKIAKQNDRTALMALLELVISAIVKCPNRETFISRIMGLAQSVQESLRVFIQKSLEKIDRLTGEDPDLKGQVTELRQTNRKLTHYLEEFQVALSEANKSQEQLQQQNEALRGELEEAKTERTSRVRKGPGQDRTSKLAVELEEQVVAKEAKVQELLGQINDLTRKHAEEVRSFKDDLDVYRDLELKLTQTEAQLEHYRKQADEVNTYKKKLKEAQNELVSLQGLLKDYEEDGGDAATVRQALAYYKNQLTVERDRTAEQALALEEQDKQLKELQKARKELEDNRILMKNEITLLRTELERNRLADSSDDSFLNSSKCLQGDLEDQIEKLRAENKALRSQLGPSPVLDDLNQQIDEAYKAKKAAEEKLKQQVKAVKEQQRQLEFVQKEYADYQTETSAKLNQLQNDLMTSNEQAVSLQKEVDRQAKIMVDFEKIRAERDSHIIDIKALYREKDSLNEKLIDQKEESHGLQNRCTQLDTALKACEREKEKMENALKEARESERIALNELEVHKKNQSTAAVDLEKIKFLELQRDNLRLEGQISNLKLVLREKEDVNQLLQQEKERNEAALREDIVSRETKLKANYEEEIRKINSLLNQRDVEITYLNKTKEELTKDWNREMRMMSTVMHELGLEIMRVNRCFQDDKTWFTDQHSR